MGSDESLQQGFFINSSTARYVNMLNFSVSLNVGYVNLNNLSIKVGYVADMLKAYIFQVWSW